MAEGGKRTHLTLLVSLNDEGFSTLQHAEEAQVEMVLQEGGRQGT